MTTLTRRLSGSILPALCASAVAQSPVTFQVLSNVLPPGAIVAGISDDGTTLIGSYTPTTGSFPHGFRLRQSTVQDLGVLPNHNTSSAAATNRDGDVVVGASAFQSVQFPLPLEATRAGPNSQFGGLGILQGGTMSVATAVDASGDVIVGWGNSTSGAVTPVLWLLGVIHTLSTGGSTDNMQPTAVDDVGTRICGNAEDSSGNRRAILWSGAGSGPVDLPPLPGHNRCETIAISSAGDVVVGRSWSQFESLPVRWIHGVPESLGQPRYAGVGNEWFVHCANADCTLIGGEGRYTSQPIAPRAMLWKQGRGWIDVPDLLARLGVNLGGHTLMSIQAISADGAVIAGRTASNETFVLRNLPLDGFHVRDIGCGVGADIYHYGVPALGQGIGFEVFAGGNQTWILAGVPVTVPVPGCQPCSAGALDVLFATNSLFIHVPNVTVLVGATITFQGLGTLGWPPYPCFGSLKFTSAVDVTLR